MIILCATLCRAATSMTCGLVQWSVSVFARVTGGNIIVSLSPPLIRMPSCYHLMRQEATSSCRTSVNIVAGAGVIQKKSHFTRGDTGFALEAFEEAPVNRNLQPWFAKACGQDGYCASRVEKVGACVCVCFSLGGGGFTSIFIHNVDTLFPCVCGKSSKGVLSRKGFCLRQRWECGYPFPTPFEAREQKSSECAFALLCWQIRSNKTTGTKKRLAWS